MKNSVQKAPIFDIDLFAQDFVSFLADRERRNPQRAKIVVVSDERWDDLLAVTAPYRGDHGNVDQRIGIAYAIKQPITHKEIPDLIKTLFPELAEAMSASDLIVALNMQTLTHPMGKDPEQAFNSVFNNIVILCEKALVAHGYQNLSPVADSLSFMKHYSAVRYIISK